MQIIPLNLDSVLLLLHNSKLAYSKFWYYRYEIFDFEVMINPKLETAIQNQNSETWNQNLEIGNLKPEIRIQKLQIAVPKNLKSTIEKSEIKSLISEMPLVTSSSDNHGLSQFAMLIFRISNR